jgi:membrane protein implicated in regulation of membrane protease activity
VFQVVLAIAFFVICVAVGGILLLITVLLDDILGGVLDFMHVDFDLGGVTLMPLLLGFVSMFGVGGLFGTQILNLSPGVASLLGGTFGLIGAAIVFFMFRFLRRAEAPPTFGLSDLVGQRGRVAVGIVAGRPGAVLISYAGSTQNLTASADVDIPAGAVVVVTDVAGTTVVVTPVTSPAVEGGAESA